MALSPVIHFSRASVDFKIRNSMTRGGLAFIIRDHVRYTVKIDLNC